MRDHYVCRPISPDVAEFRLAVHRPGVELYRAHLVRQSFDPHIHEGFGLGAIETGVERFRYCGAEHLAPQDSLVTMNSDEVHTGRSEIESGWRYRMIYVEPATLSAIAGESWWFAQPVHTDPPNARRVTALLEAMWDAREPLAFDSLLHQLLASFRRYAKLSRAASHERDTRFTPVLDYLHVHLSRRLTLDELADVAGLSPFHFLRRFQAAHHATPQQMLMALRLSEAKRRLAHGEPPAQVTATVGLTDQAHLTRSFARRYGVTPARYQRALRQ